MFFIPRPNEVTIIAQVGTAWACDNLFDQSREGKKTGWTSLGREGGPRIDKIYPIDANRNPTLSHGNALWYDIVDD